jgi:hypothetical protein
VIVEQVNPKRLEAATQRHGRSYVQSCWPHLAQERPRG